MLIRSHIDEIDDDQTAEIAQAQLADNLLYRFEIRGEYRRCWIALANKPAGVDIDSDKRFRVVNDNIATRFQPDFALQGAFDFSFDAKRLEKWGRVLIVHEICHQM